MSPWSCLKRKETARDEFLSKASSQYNKSADHIQRETFVLLHDIVMTVRSKGSKNSLRNAV